jgi:hypothetical protein
MMDAVDTDFTPAGIQFKRNRRIFEPLAGKVLESVQWQGLSVR